MLSCNKWTTGHLGVRWQVTVAKTYGRVTWRLGLEVKVANKGLFMSEKGEGLTTGTDSSYGIGHDLGIKRNKWHQWRMTSLSDGGCQMAYGEKTSGPIDLCHL
jgi:hypothetical protein